MAHLAIPNYLEESAQMVVEMQKLAKQCSRLP